MAYTHVPLPPNTDKCFLMGVHTHIHVDTLSTSHTNKHMLTHMYTCIHHTRQKHIHTLYMCAYIYKHTTVYINIHTHTTLHTNLCTLKTHINTGHIAQKKCSDYKHTLIPHCTQAYTPNIHTHIPDCTQTSTYYTHNAHIDHTIQKHMYMNYTLTYDITYLHDIYTLKTHIERNEQTKNK